MKRRHPRSLARPIPVTLDTGALIELQRRDKRISDFVRDARTNGTELIVPANALAEWWRGGGRGQEDVLESLKPFEARPVDQVVAKLAGRALEWYWRQQKARGERTGKHTDMSDDKHRVTASLTVDATILATACLAAGDRPEPVQVYTSDRRVDIKRLLGFEPFVRVLLVPEE